MKINLSGLPRLKLMTGASPQRIMIQCKYKQSGDLNKKEYFELK